MKIYRDTFTNTISELTIGKNTLNTGGENALPFYSKDGKISPVLTAFEIWDKMPANQSKHLHSAWGDVWHSPAEWALKAKNEYGAKLLCINLISSKHDEGATDEHHAISCIESVAKAAALPLIVKGCGEPEADNKILCAVCKAFKGENFLVGPVTLENYKDIALSVLENGHSIIAQSPIDINIAKQLNIMLTDAGVPLCRIAADPTTGALGYGLEYSFSIMERAKLAALGGDKVLAVPFINFIGAEAWRAKEADSVGPIWEAVTALTYVQAGCAIAVIRHPYAAELLNKNIKMLSGEANEL